MDCSSPGSSVHGITPGKNTGVGCHTLLQGIFPTQRSNLCLLHWQVDSLPLSHQGSPMYPQFSSVQFSRSVVSDSLWSHESQHTRPPCPSPTPGVHSDSRPLSQWCHPAISSSVIPFSSCCQSLPASESFPMSQLFAWGGQSTGVSALTSFLPKNTQDWSPLEWTGWISLQSKELSRVFSNTKMIFIKSERPLQDLTGGMTVGDKVCLSVCGLLVAFPVTRVSLSSWMKLLEREFMTTEFLWRICL